MLTRTHVRMTCVPTPASSVTGARRGAVIGNDADPSIRYVGKALQALWGTPGLLDNNDIMSLKLSTGNLKTDTDATPKFY